MTINQPDKYKETMIAMDIFTGKRGRQECKKEESGELAWQRIENRLYYIETCNKEPNCEFYLNNGLCKGVELEPIIMRGGLSDADTLRWLGVDNDHPYNHSKHLFMCQYMRQPNRFGDTYKRLTFRDMAHAAMWVHYNSREMFQIFFQIETLKLPRHNDWKHFAEVMQALELLEKAGRGELLYAYHIKSGEISEIGPYSRETATKLIEQYPPHRYSYFVEEYL